MRNFLFVVAGAVHTVLAKKTYDIGLYGITGLAIAVALSCLAFLYFLREDG